MEGGGSAMLQGFLAALSNFWNFVLTSTIATWTMYITIPPFIAIFVGYLLRRIAKIFGILRN